MCRITMGHLRVTIGHLRVTVGHPRVTIGHLRVTMGHLKAGCQNTREWGIRFPERSGLNHNLAERFRKICEIEKQQTGSCQPDSMIKLAFTYLFAD